jgi:hypothetical protein
MASLPPDSPTPPESPEVAPVTASEPTPPRLNGTRGAAAAGLAWLIPGLGHLWLGDRIRGAAFAVILLGLFFGGIGLGGEVYAPGEGDLLTTLAAVGSAGIGLPYGVAWQLGWGQGGYEAPFFEYGSTFTLAAGLLNVLVLLDAFDLGSGRRP